jgi:hypothetical protein
VIFHNYYKSIVVFTYALIVVQSYFSGDRNLMYILMEVADKATYARYIQLSLLAISIGGLLLATILGAIAWYNSKKPAGWENSEIPGWIPKVSSGKPKDKSSQN